MKCTSIEGDRRHRQSHTEMTRFHFWTSSFSSSFVWPFNFVNSFHSRQIRTKFWRKTREKRFANYSKAQGDRKNFCCFFAASVVSVAVHVTTHENISNYKTKASSFFINTQQWFILFRFFFKNNAFTSFYSCAPVSLNRSTVLYENISMNFSFYFHFSFLSFLLSQLVVIDNVDDVFLLTIFFLSDVANFQCHDEFRNELKNRV